MTDKAIVCRGVTSGKFRCKTFKIMAVSETTKAQAQGLSQQGKVIPCCRFNEALQIKA